mmetsp:Transcript_130293/g.418065  ORF Transcript_130293/g.418065 Transcript_130293/m.418065 type:complete len:91 (+) Transcript_130293:131-403(+)
MGAFVADADDLPCGETVDEEDVQRYLLAKLDALGGPKKAKTSQKGTVGVVGMIRTIALATPVVAFVAIIGLLECRRLTGSVAGQGLGISM